MLALLWLFQRQLIFVGAYSTVNADRKIRPNISLPHTWLDLQGGQSGRIAAIYVAATDAAGNIVKDIDSRPTVLYCYGNGGSIANSTGMLSGFSALGCNVIVTEYPGYPLTGGLPSETGCYDAVEAAYAYLVERDPDIASKLVLVGWSLGGAVALELATRRPCAGLVTLCAFTSMADIANFQYPVFPKTLLKAIVRHSFDNLRKVTMIGCPIMIVHGMRDRTVPFTMASALENAAGGHVTRVNLPDAGHGDIFEASSKAADRAIADFIRSVVWDRVFKKSLIAE